MSEDLLRRLGKELALLVRGRLVERGCNRLCFGAAAQLLGRPPVRAAGVQRIQNDVAVLAVIEPLNELAGRIVDDGRMTPFFDLHEYLHDEPGLARARVAHQLDVLPFGEPGNAHELLRFDGSEANSIALHCAIESGWRDANRAFEQASILHFPEPIHVFARGKREHAQQHNKPGEQRPAEDSGDAVPAIDELLKIGMKRAIPVDGFRSAIEVNQTGGAGARGQLKRQWPREFYRGHARLHIGSGGRMRMKMVVRNVEKLVLAGLLQSGQCAGLNERPEVVAFERRHEHTYIDAQKYSGQNQRQRDGRIAIDGSLRRRNDCFLASPMRGIHSCSVLLSA